MDVVIYDVMTNQETKTQLERLPGMSLDDLLSISSGKKYTHKELLEDPILLYQMIDQAKKKLSDPLVRRPPKEAIVVLFDISGSM